MSDTKFDSNDLTQPFLKDPEIRLVYRRWWAEHGSHPITVQGRPLSGKTYYECLRCGATLFRG